MYYNTLCNQIYYLNKYYNNYIINTISHKDNNSKKLSEIIKGYCDKLSDNTTTESAKKDIMNIFNIQIDDIQQIKDYINHMLNKPNFRIPENISKYKNKCTQKIKYVLVKNK